MPPCTPTSLSSRPAQRTEEQFTAISNDMTALSAALNLHRGVIPFFYPHPFQPADEDHRFAYALELAKKLGLVVSGDTVALAHGHMSGISSLTSFRMVVLA